MKSEYEMCNAIVHFCKLCGVVINPRRTKTGKHKGSIYYTKLCQNCLPVHRVALARQNINYDKFRKHFSRKCEACGFEFDVRGKRNSGTVKTCSPECESTLHRNNAVRRDYAHTTLAANRHKGWKKTFESPQTKETVKLGPTHWNSSKVVFRSPDGKLYNVCNIVHFVRTHQNLFATDDVQWVPIKKRSKVDAVGRRPSKATGCLNCRATSGLHGVASGRRGSWKDWAIAGMKNKKAE